MKIVFFVVIFFNLIFIQNISAQNKFEKGYFQFPIKPGQQNFLTGSMGELRPNHFHAGIDVKTDFKTGLPIYASAEGYVSRIKISSFGYGKVLYITHPNGLTTVYAHLEGFNDTIADYIVRKQYEQECFDLEIYPDKGILPVKKGEKIAYSGNTGSSGGPHLHYEVRDAEEKALNPLLFGFNEVKDNLPPVFDILAIRTFDINSRIENEFGRKEFLPVKTGKNFILNKPVKALGELGLEIKVHDRMDGTQSNYGITCLEVKINGKEVFYHNLSSIAFDEMKYINAHIDYETLVNKNQRFQKCYIGDGNKLSSYKNTGHNGKINIEENKTYQVEITLYDAYNNSSKLNFNITGAKPITSITAPDLSKAGYRIFENILKIKGKQVTDTAAVFYLKNKTKQVSPDYKINGFPVFLYDLRTGLIDSISIGSYTEKFNFVAMIPSGVEYKYNHKNFSIKFSDSTLFDTLYLQLKSEIDPSGKEVFHMHKPTEAIFGKIELSYDPDEIEDLHPQSYIAMNGTRYEESENNNEAIYSQVKYFGKFAIAKDTMKPLIRYVSHTPKSIKLNITDRGSGIASYRATLDGKWLLMNYEHKKSLVWSENMDKNLPLKGKFVLEVKDKVGNLTRFEKNL